MTLARAATLWALCGLILLGLAWELWWAPTGRGTWALKVLPLLLCTPGLWRGRLYSYRVMSLVVWLYFCEGVVRATSEGGWSRPLATMQVLLSLALFVACVQFIRGQPKVAPAATHGDSSR